MPSKVEQPVCLEVSVSRTAGGGVGIKEYGKIKSNYSFTFTRRYAIPSSWDKETTNNFLIAEEQELAELLEPLDQAAFEERYAQRDWDD